MPTRFHQNWGSAVLSRVLKNMVKNAVEAGTSGDTVTIGCNNSGDVVEFWMHIAF